MPNDNYANEPNQSRSEDIIQSILDNTEYDEEARSRIEYLLIELKNAIEGGGGGGGVTSYAPLTEKPKIDNHILQAGNNSSSDLGLQTKLTFDSAPTENSTNPVTSGGVYTALDSKANSSDVYNKSAIDTALTAKADKSTTYTKSEVDTALGSKQNAIDSSHKLSADLVDDTNATNKFATAEELEQIQTNKNNISLLETKTNTNAAIISQTYNSADCNMSIYLCQDKGAINDSTYYMTDLSKMHFTTRYFRRLMRYWKDGVDYQKYRWSSVGVIATNNSTKKNMLTLDIPEVTDETYIKIYHYPDDDAINIDGRYTWNKSSANVGDVWYIRPHIEYTDLETGMEYTMYGAVYKVTVGVPCTIECDTLSCTELTQIVGDINSVLEEVL